MIDNTIYTANIMFPDELCDYVIEIFDKKEKAFRQNGFNDDYNEGHFHKNLGNNLRLDEQCFVDEMDMMHDVGDGNLITKINMYLIDALKEYSSFFEQLSDMPLRSTRQKLQKTKPSGGYHVWHCEQSTLDFAERVLTWSIYLNTIEEGGETEFLHQSKRIKAEKGKILLFPASFTHLHRGNPPLMEDKYILTGWFNLF